MIIKDVKKIYKNRKFVEIEVYKQDKRNARHGFHGDFMKYLSEDEWTDDMEVIDYEIMNEEEYNRSVCANCNEADFKEYYDDKNARVLVVTTTGIRKKFVLVEDLGDHTWHTQIFDTEQAAEDAAQQMLLYLNDKEKSEREIYVGSCEVDVEGHIDYNSIIKLTEYLPE